MKREKATGIHAVEALVEYTPERIVRVWIQSNNRRLEALADRLRGAGVSVENGDHRALDRRSGGERHQGVVAEFHPREPIDESQLAKRLAAAGEQALVLVLDGVKDPHNLGACLRSAAAAGATAVVIPKDRAAGLTPAARRAAAGAAEIVPLAVVTNLARGLRRLAESGLWRVGLAAEAGASLFSLDHAGPLAVIVGGEERGLRRLTREHCDELRRIPMPGSMESLNVSVSAGIALFSIVGSRSP